MRSLAIHDTDAARRDQLIAKLKTVAPSAKSMPAPRIPPASIWSRNATPLGMKPGDPLPIDVSKLASGTFVGCVITMPAVSPAHRSGAAPGLPDLDRHRYVRCLAEFDARVPARRRRIEITAMFTTSTRFQKAPATTSS